jgi:hypothetical protein
MLPFIVPDVVVTSDASSVETEGAVPAEASVIVTFTEELGVLVYLVWLQVT